MGTFTPFTPLFFSPVVCSYRSRKLSDSVLTVLTVFTVFSKPMVKGRIRRVFTVQYMTLFYFFKYALPKNIGGHVRNPAVFSSSAKLTAFNLVPNWQNSLHTLARPVQIAYYIFLNLIYLLQTVQMQTPKI